MTKSDALTAGRTDILWQGNRLFSAQDATENAGYWLCFSELLPVTRASRPATQPILFQWHMSEAASITEGETEHFAAIYSGAILHVRDRFIVPIAAQENSSDLTNEPTPDFGDEASAGSRWMDIVHEEFGTPSEAPTFEDPGSDLVFQDKATVDCVRFCNEHGILRELRSCLDKAEELFSGIVAINAEFDQFPSDEYEEDGHVVIRVKVASEQGQAFQDYDSYMDWMLDNIVKEKTQYFFVTFDRGV